MKITIKKALFVAALAGLILAAPTKTYAHSYDRDDSDHPLRYVAYLFHPVGIFLQDFILRPIHRFVSSDEPWPNFEIEWLQWLNSDKPRTYWFGHDPADGETY